MLIREGGENDISSEVAQVGALVNKVPARTPGNVTAFCALTSKAGSPVPLLCFQTFHVNTDRLPDGKLFLLKNLFTHLEYNLLNSKTCFKTMA